MAKERLFLVLPVIMTALFLTACNKNDDNISGNGDTLYVVDNDVYKYDTMGRWTSKTGSSPGNGSTYKDIVYGDDAITMRTTSDQGYYTIDYNWTLMLNDRGLVETITQSSTVNMKSTTSTMSSHFTYDDDGQLIKQTTNRVTGTSNTYYEWKDGNIVSSHTENVAGKLEYKYSDDTYKGNIIDYILNPAPIGIGFQCDFLFDYGYFGKRCRNLCIEEIPSEGSSANHNTYSYQLDSEGYVIAVTGKYVNSSGYTGSKESWNIKYRKL